MVASQLGMSNHCRVTRLYEFLVGDVTEEKERSPMEYGRFDDSMNFHYVDGPEIVTLYPWEWRLDPEVVKMAERKGIEIPDDTIDLSRTF